MITGPYQVAEKETTVITEPPLPVAAADANRDTSSWGGVVHPRIDWREASDAHILKVDVPGLKKGEVKV